MVLAIASITLAKVSDGQKGEPGQMGADGRTQYLHIKYSDDGETFTADSGETLGAWIGTLVDFEELDSDVFSDYTWKKFTEDVDDELEEITKVIRETQANIVTTSESVVANALENYVETSEHESLKSQTEAQFALLADAASFDFAGTTETVKTVDGKLQAIEEKLNKHFDFTLEDGLIIKVGENQMQLQLDNDVISFKKNGVQFGWWDGVDFHTGNIVVAVEERAQFGNFAFVPRSDGSLMFLKVGG